MPQRSKYDDKVSEVEIIEGNEKYATIEHPSGRQEIVSSQRLAPFGTYNLAEDTRTRRIQATLSLRL
ncbi:hypothetical protein ACOME3_004649, partial [Neoechinorhynchus agilis]